jgi:hypothetical protein
MATQEQVQSYLEQPKRYYNIDGLGEISIGVMMLGFALISWLQASTPKVSLWNRQSSFFVCVALMLIVIDHGAKAVKKRITYPRTGFVEYRRDAKARMAPMVLGAVTAAAFGFLMKYGRVNPAAVAGMIVVPTYAYGVARAVQWKWLTVAVLAVGSGAIASLPTGLLASIARDAVAGPKSRFTPDMVGSWLIEALFIGATIGVSGGITLLRYLRETQAPEGAAE